MTLTCHESTVGAGPTTVGINLYWGSGNLVYLCTHTVEPQLAVMDMIGGGVLHRHPRLRVGLLEAHVSWLPGWLQLMDYKLGSHHDVPGGPLTMPPSDYFRRQCFVAIFADDVGILDAFEYLGPDNLVFSSDWPHKSLDERTVRPGRWPSGPNSPPPSRTACCTPTSAMAPTVTPARLGAVSERGSVGMDFAESGETRMLRDSVDGIARSTATPTSSRWPEAVARPTSCGTRWPRPASSGSTCPRSTAVAGAASPSWPSCSEELAAAGCPLLVIVVSPAICATIIAKFGTEAQKQRWLPGVRHR